MPSPPTPPTPPSPEPNVGSQLDRAIVAWLIANTVGTAANIFPANSVAIKAYPCIIVKSFQSDHDPVLSGSEYWRVQIQTKGSATNQPNAANPGAVWAALDAFHGFAKACLMQSDNNSDLAFIAAQLTAWGQYLAMASPQNNADMAQFTCQEWYFKGATRGEPDEPGCSWVEISHFEARAAGIALS